MKNHAIFEALKVVEKDKRECGELYSAHRGFEIGNSWDSFVGLLLVDASLELMSEDIPAILQFFSYMESGNTMMVPTRDAPELTLRSQGPDDYLILEFNEGSYEVWPNDLEIVVKEMEQSAQKAIKDAADYRAQMVSCHWNH